MRINFRQSFFFLAAGSFMLSSLPSKALVKANSLAPILVEKTEVQLRGTNLNSKENPFKATLITADGQSLDLITKVNPAGKVVGLVLPALPESENNIFKVTLNISGGDVPLEKPQQFIRLLSSMPEGFSSNLEPQLLANLPSLGPNLSAGLGAVGPQGPAGPQGPVGPQGSAGSQGPAGARGEVGPQGPAGPQGLAGPQGIQGPMGPQGEVGPQGPAGPQGTSSPQVVQGPAGPQGPQGVAGPQGPEGPQGPKGDTNPLYLSFQAGRDYDPSNWYNDTLSAPVTGTLRVPNTILVNEGNAGTGWLTFRVGPVKACYQGAAANSTIVSKRFILRNFYDSSIACDAIGSASPLSVSDNTLSVTAADEISLSINGGGVASTVRSFTSVIIPRVQLIPQN